MEVSELPKPGTAEQTNHKNRLQGHTQRSVIPLPLYQTVNEGSQHAPQFRSTVVVDGAVFMSSCTFARRKAAELDVARVALESISWKIKHEGVPLIDNDTILCKSILHEYAAKMKIEKPTYTTAESNGLFRLFISSVVFNGKTYTGREEKNKKEAEQTAARTVIQSILGTSDIGTTIYQIIKSKDKLYAAMHKGGSSCLRQDGNVALRGRMENRSTNTSVKEKVQGALTSDKLPAVANVEAFTSKQPAKSAATNSILTEAKKHKEGYICEFPGSVISDTALSALPQSGTTARSTGWVVSVPTVQSIQVKKEVPLDGQSVGSSGSQSIFPNSDRKRTRKKKKGKHSKKARTNDLDCLWKDLNLKASADDCESSHVRAW